MMNSISKKYDGLFISSKPKPLLFLNYQLVYLMNDGNKYLKSIKILFRDEIIREYPIKKRILIKPNTDLQKIIKDQLISEMISANFDEQNSSREKNKSRPKPNDEARAKFAADLFSQMGI